MQADEYSKLILQAHQLHLLRVLYPAFRSRLSDVHSAAVSWVVEHTEKPSSAEIPNNWKNAYDRAVKAADFVVERLADAQKLNQELNQTSSVTSQKISVDTKVLNDPAMSEKPALGKMPATSITLSDDQFQSLMQNMFSQATANVKSESFRAQDIGFFDPNNEAAHVEMIDSRTMYHNVFSFTARLKALALDVTSGPFTPSSVACKLHQCLRGKAELWYTNEISPTTRAGLRTGIELWCSELENRFREAPSTSLAKLEKLRYTTGHVRARRDPEEFIQQVIVHGKGSGSCVTEHSQILTAWNHLSPELRITIPQPSTTTTLTEFVKSITAVKQSWFDLYRPQTNFSDGSYRRNPYHDRNDGRYASSRPQSSQISFQRQENNNSKEQV
ncbi:hypothetical protein Golomagni_06333, partial [Golovinomyces magnicellulatus]